MDFVEFPKIASLNREIIVTEKVDGTNAQVTVAPAVENPPVERLRVLTAIAELNGQQYDIFAGSRTRWITPENDNFGFARWVQENAAELVKLGIGSHFGEWWGAGIQRRYGLTERRWSLFNVSRWADDIVRPACCHVVPVLARGIGFAMADIATDILEREGSKAAPGFMDPEGIVAYHVASREMFKATLKNDSEWKGKAQAA